MQLGWEAAISTLSGHRAPWESVRGRQGLPAPNQGRRCKAGIDAEGKGCLGQGHRRPLHHPPTHPPRLTGNCLRLCRGEVAEWWTSQWLLPGEQEPLGREGALVAHKVTRAFADAVEALEPSMQGSVADQLQATKREVRPLGCLGLGWLLGVPGLAWGSSEQPVCPWERKVVAKMALRRWCSNQLRCRISGQGAGHRGAPPGVQRKKREGRQKQAGAWRMGGWAGLAALHARDAG
jgi:hypothetical protein